MKMFNSTTESQLMEGMLLLGSMYDIGSANSDDAASFQNVLDYYDSNKDDGFYDIRSVMEKVCIV